MVLPLSPRIPDVHYESATEQFPDVIGPTPPPADDDEPISNESLSTGDGWEIVAAGIAVQRPIGRARRRQFPCSR